MSDVDKYLKGFDQMQPPDPAPKPKEKQPPRSGKRARHRAKSLTRQVGRAAGDFNDHQGGNS